MESYTPQLNINTPAKTRTNTYDGNGKPVKTQETSGSNSLQSFEINSTVLSGATVGSFGTSNGVEQKTFSAPVNGATFYGESVGNMALHWTGGEGLRKYVNSYQATESDPRGEEVELDNPYNSLQGPSAESNYAGCSWEGLQMSCEMTNRMNDFAAYVKTFNRTIYVPKPEKISIVHEAMHGTPTAQATSNTQKPPDSSSAGSPVSPNSVPDDSYDPYNNDYEITPEGMTIRSRGNEVNGNLTVSGFAGADVGSEILVFFKDNNDAKAALSEVVKKGDCGTMLEKLFGNLITTAPYISFSNPVRNTNVLSLFDESAGQKKGGLYTNSSSAEGMAQYKTLFPNGEPIAGGGGMTFSDPVMRHPKYGFGMQSEMGANMYVHVFPTNVYNNGRTTKRVLEQRIATQRFHLVNRLIHEMAHGAGKNRTFTHEDMDEAAKAADSEIGKVTLHGAGSYFNKFLQVHCGL